MIASILLPKEGICIRWTVAVSFFFTRKSALNMRSRSFVACRWDASSHVTAHILFLHFYSTSVHAGRPCCGLNTSPGPAIVVGTLSIVSRRVISVHFAFNADHSIGSIPSIRYPMRYFAEQCLQIKTDEPSCRLNSSSVRSPQWRTSNILIQIAAL